MILDNLAYVISSFEGFLREDIDYATWFLESSTVSEGKVLRGIA